MKNISSHHRNNGQQNSYKILYPILRVHRFTTYIIAYILDDHIIEYLKRIFQKFYELSTSEAAEILFIRGMTLLLPQIHVRMYTLNS
jgi:hypothetical protein